MRGINFENGQVFFVGCRCVRVIKRVGGTGLKGSATTVCKQITPEDGRGLRPKHVEL